MGLFSQGFLEYLIEISVQIVFTQTEGFRRGIIEIVNLSRRIGGDYEVGHGGEDILLIPFQLLDLFQVLLHLLEKTGVLKLAAGQFGEGVEEVEPVPVVEPGMPGVEHQCSDLRLGGEDRQNHAAGHLLVE